MSSIYLNRAIRAVWIKQRVLSCWQSFQVWYVFMSVSLSLLLFFVISSNMSFSHSLLFFLHLLLLLSISVHHLLLISSSFLLPTLSFAFFLLDHPSLLHTRECFADTKRLSCFDPPEPLVASFSSWLVATQHGKRTKLSHLSAFTGTGFHSADG